MRPQIYVFHCGRRPTSGCSQPGCGKHPAEPCGFTLNGRKAGEGCKLFACSSHLVTRPDGTKVCAAHGRILAKLDEKRKKTPGNGVRIR